MKTTVVSARNLPNNWRSNPNYVYIGRPSIFGNPFPLSGGESRKSVLKKYVIYLRDKLKDPEFFKRVSELKGKKLVCWCKPLPCHGDFLAVAADSPEYIEEYIQLYLDAK